MVSDLDKEIINKSRKINQQRWKEVPETADCYRLAYIEGIQKYIQRRNRECKQERKHFFSPEELKNNQETYRMHYKKMLGIDQFDKESSKLVQMYEVGADEVCRIYRLTVYITEEIPFYALLLIPHAASKPMPLVITQHGGGGTPELCSDFYGTNNYNHIVQRSLQRGAAVLAPQLLLWAQTESETMRAHPIPYNRHDVDIDLKRFGSSITALEISGIRKCLDYVCSLEEIAADKVAMAGLSYGGYFTLHTMAADTRIKAGYCAGVFNDRDLYNWSDWCYFQSAVTFQDAEVAALCAPRRLYVQVGMEDQVFDYRTAVLEAERVKDYYKILGEEENFVFDVWEGGHTISLHNKGYDFIFDKLL